MFRLLPACCAILSFVAFDCAAQTKALKTARGTKVEATLNFEITAEKTQLVVLDVLLPQSQTGRQKVIAVDYTVRPASEYEKEGQRYAQFRLTKFPAALAINLQAEVYRYDLATARAAPQRSAETKESLAQWLVHEQYLEKDDAAIQNVAKTLTGDDDEDVVWACFDYVVKTMRQAQSDKNTGAGRAIIEKRGDCTEFAEVFIALCRAKGIPARFCNGYVLAPVKGSAMHDWAEVHFEKYGWVPFDPLYAHLNQRAFSDLRPIYLTVERHSRNSVLNLGQLWASRSQGDGPVKITDTFTVKNRVDAR